MIIADYVADFLVDKGVTDCFTVVGGGAMFLNNSLGHKGGLKCTYFHHEQAAAIAAESYARYENRIAALCVTTGPGGTNALTGVVGGWLDSIPMFVISGQVRYDTTARYAMRYTEGLPLRSVGDQEFDITKCAQHMCKYATMLEKPEQIKYVLEKAWHYANTGRPGPVWIDIPVNYQGMNIDVANLVGYNTKQDEYELPIRIDDDMILDVLREIERAERPIIYAGGGVRLSNSYLLFRKVVERLGVPVCTYWNSIDLLEDEHPLYCGRGGNMGDRAGNFAIQNADLLLVLGSRLSIRQVGYNWDTWAREARVIMVDIDKAEMKKPSIHVDVPIWSDLADFLNRLVKATENKHEYVSHASSWRAQCQSWKERYPVVSEQQKSERSEKVNVYGFFRTLSEKLPVRSFTAVSNGACCVVGHQSWCIKQGTRFINNNAIASMGYGLPASIGLCLATGGEETFCMEGDGSIMMNLQELQTIVTNKLPIKVFLINNEGYHSIRITQNNLFSDYSHVGIGPESGDLSFPEYKKIADAFGLPYMSIRSGKELRSGVETALSQEGALLCEVFTDTTQVWEPKSSAKRRKDGTLFSPPLEDLAPFLPREEVKTNMFIPMVQE